MMAPQSRFIVRLSMLLFTYYYFLEKELLLEKD